MRKILWLSVFIILFTFITNSFAQAFTKISTNLTGVGHSSINLSNFHNDGYLDVLLTGQDNNWIRKSEIYKNNGNNYFTVQTDISGKTLKQYYSDKNDNIFSEDMDLTEFGKGIYFIEIEYNGKNNVTKVVVE